MTLSDIQKQTLRAWEESTYAAGAVADAIKALRDDSTSPEARGTALDLLHQARKHNQAASSLLNEPISTLATSLQVSTQ